MGFPLAADDDGFDEDCDCNLPGPELSAIGGGSGIGDEKPFGGRGGRLGGAGGPLKAPGSGGGGGPEKKKKFVENLAKPMIGLTWHALTLKRWGWGNVHHGWRWWRDRS